MGLYFCNYEQRGGEQLAPETVYQENVLEVEPFGIEPIPREERHGQVSKIFTFWFASSLNVVTWFTGFLGIEFGLSLKYAVIAIIIGNLLGGGLLALTSAVGPRIGQPLIPGQRPGFSESDQQHRLAGRRPGAQRDGLSETRSFPGLPCRPADPDCRHDSDRCLWL